MQISENGITNGTHIAFDPAPPNPKTKTWWVVSKYDGRPCLGVIAWFAQWRKYSFYPNADTVYEEVCLWEIGEFCQAQTRLHKEKKCDKTL